MAPVRPNHRACFSALLLANAIFGFRFGPGLGGFAFFRLTLRVRLGVGRVFGGLVLPELPRTVPAPVPVFRRLPGRIPLDVGLPPS